MKFEEVAKKGIVKGAFYDVAWTRPMKVRKEVAERGIVLKKSVQSTCKFDVNFKNTKKCNDEYRAKHTEGAIPPGLQFKWVIENLLGMYKSGKEFLRATMVDGTKPKVIFTKVENGVETEVTRDEVMPMCLASEFPKTENDSGCLNITLENITSFARNH